MEALLATLEVLPPGEENVLDTTFQRLLHGPERHGIVRSTITGGPFGFGDALDDFVVGGYLTETYARKGWFTRLLHDVTNGTYDIGRDNGRADAQAESRVACDA